MSLGGQPQINFRVVKAGDELKLGNGLSGKVGGHMRVQLSIMLLPNTRVNPNVRTVTVRLAEEPDEANSVEHPDAENHVDVTLCDTRLVGSAGDKTAKPRFRSP